MFSFRNLSNLICSCRVRLYVLKDFCMNPSFNSILWSQDQGLGNRAAFSSEKTSRNLWNSLGICSSKGNTVLFELISACNWVAMVDFELIQISLSVSPVIEAISSDNSLSSSGFCVWLRYASLSSSSEMVTGLFFGDCLKTIFLLGCLQENSPVFQLISRLCSLSQGNLRMIHSFPRPVTSNWVFVFLPFFFPSQGWRKIWSFLICSRFRPHCRLEWAFPRHVFRILISWHRFDRWIFLQLWSR